VIELKINIRELSVDKMSISGLLFAYDLANPSFTFIGLQKVENQVAKHCREWNLKHNLHKIKILVCQIGVNERYKRIIHRRQTIETVDEMTIQRTRFRKVFQTVISIDKSLVRTPWFRDEYL
jgi:hypothetical protein